MRTLLHISDVHFGPPHRPRVSDGVVELAAARRPDLVILSGDLTQRARPEQFAEARRFVDRIPVPTLEYCQQLIVGSVIRDEFNVEVGKITFGTTAVVNTFLELCGKARYVILLLIRSTNVI